MPTDALITQQLGSLVNGISRQPAQQRLPSQGESQVNVVSDVAAGAKRRPPSEFIALLTGSLAGATPTGGYAFHTIDRGEGERFAVVVEDGDINVYDLSDGTEVVVNDSAAGAAGSYTYLDFDAATLTAEEAFELVTVADYTFVVNRNIVPAMSGVASAGRAQVNEFIFSARQGAPTGAENRATLYFDGAAVTSAAPAGSATNSLAAAMGDAVIGGSIALATPTAGAGSAANWTFTLLDDNTLYGYQDDVSGGVEQITSSDFYGDSIHRLFATGAGGEEPQAKQFSELPPRGQDGFVVQVKGDDGNDNDDFYVVYSEADGIWKESKKPGLDDSFDADTLPHALVYDSGTGEFTFQSIAWADRAVGDTVSAPVPSFIGSPIKGVGVHENRLTFVAGENVVGSEAGEFFNFWPTSVTTLIDSDPIDIAGTGTRVSDWNYALPFRGNLTLFSVNGGNVGELVGSRDSGLSTSNARIVERGAYGVSDVRPAQTGDSIYFLLDRGGRTSVMQYREKDIELYEADEITAHVSDYLPTGIFKLSASRAENFICALTSDTANDHKVFVYRFFTLGSEQVMTSWSEWEFDSSCSVLSADWIESTCYLLIERQDGVHLEKIDFGKTDEDEERSTISDLGYRVHYDSLVYLTGTYDAGTGLTTWVLPYDQATNGGEFAIVKGGAWENDRASTIAVADASTDGVITAVDDWTAFPVYIGRKYASSYEMSEPVLRGGGTADSAKGARIGGRLQLRKGRVVYADSGFFQVKILSREDTDEYINTFTSQFINEALIGATGLDDGVFQFDIGADARNARIIFYSDSFLPYTLANAEWEARFYQRSEQA